MQRCAISQTTFYGVFFLSLRDSKLFVVYYHEQRSTLTMVQVGHGSSWPRFNCCVEYSV